MQVLFEQNGGTYTQVGDYYIPDLKDEKPGHYYIGKYGRMRKRYLQAHRPILFSELTLSGKLYQHLAETDHACKERVERIIRQMKGQVGVTEALKKNLISTRSQGRQGNTSAHGFFLVGQIGQQKAYERTKDRF